MSTPQILVIDDDEQTQEIIRLYLEGVVDRLEARDGETGLTMAREHRPDAILLDIHMPHVDGLAILRRLKREPATAGIPVLIITANHNPAQIDQALAGGATDFITKPLSELALQARVKALLRGPADEGDAPPRAPDILVIDDDPHMHKIVGYLLRGLGNRILHAQDAKTGIKMAHTEKPDLILLDLAMPHMNGFQCCQALKHDAETRDIPVVFLTADESPIRSARAMESGAVDYIVKPVTKPELHARVRSALRCA